mmetsp:Transcript_9921/g.18749  ORF Transcript_9921/g.18749 Transcript_9921/m.18749 type:complete len:238 (+) Transcript_9921:383-1096(+)
MTASRGLSRMTEKCCRVHSWPFGKKMSSRTRISSSFKSMCKMSFKPLRKLSGPISALGVEPLSKRNTSMVPMRRWWILSRNISRVFLACFLYRLPVCASSMLSCTWASYCVKVSSGAKRMARVELARTSNFRECSSPSTIPTNSLKSRVPFRSLSNMFRMVLASSRLHSRFIVRKNLIRSSRSTQLLICPPTAWNASCTRGYLVTIFSLITTISFLMSSGEEGSSMPDSSFSVLRSI